MTSNIPSQFILVSNLSPSNPSTTNFGAKIQWLSNDLFLASEQAGYPIIANTTSFADGTKFDANNTNFGTQVITSERLNIYQILESDKNWINTTENTIAITPVAARSIPGSANPNLVFSGSIDNLVIADTNNPDVPLAIYNNPTLTPGWAVSSDTSPVLDPETIIGAWIYDSVTKTKLTDLEVVDLGRGILPGSIAENLDFISDIDPACYNIPTWSPNTLFNIGDRVTYGNSIYQANYGGKSGSIFNPQLWTLIPNNSIHTFVPTKWGNNQVGKTWFKTAGLRTVTTQSGTLLQKSQNWNMWFPSNTILVYEWIKSFSPPNTFTQNSTNGFIDSDNIPYTYDSVSKTYYFWVYGKTISGVQHNTNVRDLAASIQNIPSSGIPCISLIDTNAVAVYGINSYLSNNSIILHLEYQTESANNQLHNEFSLISNDGSKSWYNTPIYNKLVDSLCGMDALSNPTPDFYIPTSQKTGILNNPIQSLFVDRTQALVVYFQSINASLSNVSIVNNNSINYLSQSDPLPIRGFDLSIPSRDVLNEIDISTLPYNYKILITNDSELYQPGWSIVSLQYGEWRIIQHQLFNLSYFWKYQDWYSQTAVLPKTFTHTISTMSQLVTISYVVGDTIQVLNNGSGNSMVLLAVQDSTFSNLVELEPIYIQNGTIQFLPNLYDFNTSGIGFDASPFDSQYFDNDPYLAIRLIVKALNDNILVGSKELTSIADNAFYSVIRYILHENTNLDWLFKTSFVTVEYRNRDLGVQEDFQSDNQQLIENFLSESTPFHTRIREFKNTYYTTDYGNVFVEDFDLPSQFDTNYSQSVLNFTNNPRYSNITQLAAFSTAVGVSADENSLYIKSNGLPNHATPSFPTANVPNAITPQSWSFGIPRVINAGTVQYETLILDPTSISNGLFPSQGPYNNNSYNNGLILENALITTIGNVNPIGVATNGVPFYGPNAGQSETLYLTGNLNVQQTYTLNAVWNAQQLGVDPGVGFPNSNGAYQYYANPYLMYSQTANTHSPLIGYAWDGCPIYGPYGYAGFGNTQGIIECTSSYQLKSGQRLTPSGSPINGIQEAVWGPYSGRYIEDWHYVAGSGVLDYNNGRWCSTPEYPGGVYAYFATIANANVAAPAYPYLVGPHYYSTPYGLHYAYVNGVNTPIYTNGNITIPDAPAYNANLMVRSPDGTALTDTYTITTTPAYSAWSNNHTYYVENIAVSYYGAGYLDLSANITVSGGNGIGVSANVAALRVVSANIVSGGTLFKVGDSILMSGGAYSNAASATVSSVNIASGTITSITLDNTYIQGYTQIPVNPHATVGLNESGIGSGAIFDLTFGVESIYVARPGSGFTSTPNVAIQDGNASTNALLYPVLNNDVIRNLDIALRFDRVSATPEYISANTIYPLGFVGFSNIANTWVTSITTNANSSTIGNTSVWLDANVDLVDTSTAMNRITQSYVSNENIFAGNASLLLDGADFSGVLIDSGEFIYDYTAPSGTLYDEDEVYNADMPLCLSWRPGLIKNTAFSSIYSKFGISSGILSNVNSQYFTVNPNSVGIGNIAVSKPGNQANSSVNNDSFTLEFFINTSNSNPNIATLIDTRANSSSNFGYVVSIQNGNVCVGSNLASSYISSNAISIVPNQWHFITLTASNYSNSNVSSYMSALYVDGELIGSSNIPYTFSDTGFTIGSDVSGANVTAGFIDEIRLTVNHNRYPFQLNTSNIGIGTFTSLTPYINIPVPSQPFPRTLATDPYFIPHYTPLVWGFTNYNNEGAAILQFNSINAQSYITDMSSNQKPLLLVSYNSNLHVGGISLQNNILGVDIN